MYCLLFNGSQTHTHTHTCNFYTFFTPNVAKRIENNKKKYICSDFASIKMNTEKKLQQKYWKKKIFWGRSKNVKVQKDKVRVVTHLFHVTYSILIKYTRYT